MLVLPNLTISPKAPPLLDKVEESLSNSVVSPPPLPTSTVDVVLSPLVKVIIPSQFGGLLQSEVPAPTDEVAFDDFPIEPLNDP